MTNTEIINRVARIVRKRFEGESSGHDWYHIERVWKMARKIARKEKRANNFVVELSALLHDIADWKFHKGDLSAGPREARKLLNFLKVDGKAIEQVCYIVENVSFKGAGVKDTMKTLEGKIVQDSDRLDAIGAVGIVRNFLYAGSRNIPFYIPGKKPVVHKSLAQYKKQEAAATNHFYEKLLLLKDRMHTKTAKFIAIGRHKYLEKFLKEFFAEWEGKV